MRSNNQGQLSFGTLILACVVLNLASLGGNLLRVSHNAAEDRPLSRGQLSAYSMPRDAIAARGQSFSLKLCKSRPQFDQAIVRNAPKLVSRLLESNLSSPSR